MIDLCGILVLWCLMSGRRVDLVRQISLFFGVFLFLGAADVAQGANWLHMAWGGGQEINQVLNFRGGFSSTTGADRPTMCLEVSPWGPMSLEACGTGSGILHSSEGAEIAHFRTKWTMFNWKLESSNLKVQPGMGFAELQLSADEPGFRFGSPDGPSIETAGPEASISLQWHSSIGAGIELVGDLSMGAGWFAHAEKLLIPQKQIQPFADLTIGLGW